MDQIRVVREGTLEQAPVTAGMHRRGAAIAEDVNVLHVRTEPGAMSGWHHHGDCATYGFVLSGQLRFEFGPGGGDSVELQPGDAFLVPPGLVHREGNPGEAEQVLVALRVGPEPTVMNVSGPDAS